MKNFNEILSNVEAGKMTMSGAMGFLGLHHPEMLPSWLEFRTYLPKTMKIKNGLNPLKKGNLKLDKSVGIWNLPAGETCPNCDDCISTCYAMQPQKQYPGVRRGRFLRWMFVEFYRTEFIDAVISQIKRQDIRKVRIHESGDFYNDDYSYLWEVIARNCPETSFYFYTKSPYTEELSELPNVNRVESVLPDGSLNYGDAEYVRKKAKEFHAVICPVTAETHHGKKPQIKCGLDCTACIKKRFVVFYQH